MKVDKKSRASACFLELPHFPRAFQSDIERLQVQVSCLSACFFLKRFSDLSGPELFLISEVRPLIWFYMKSGQSSHSNINPF